jgi:multidrug efflux system membrane fusion protein
MKMLRLLPGSLLLLTAATSNTLADGNQGDPVIPVSQPLQLKVNDFVDYLGRTAAVQSVKIVPRVSGYLVNISFKEGAIVNKGQVLYEIDPRPYQVPYEAAKAQVLAEEAGLTYAKATYERFKELFKKQPGAVSERDLLQYQAQEEQAFAKLVLAKAQLEGAKLHLEWTKVTSPIDGIIGRSQLTVGNLVIQDKTPLATVVSMNPMYVYFDMDEATLLRIKRAMSDGKFKPFKDGDVPLQMGLAGENGFLFKGTIDFVDNVVNPSTASIKLRGVFNNPKSPAGIALLAPGMSVRVRMPLGQPQDELLVTDRAVVSEQGQKFVYVVDANNKVEMRRVIPGALQDDGLRVIKEGLHKDDWVVVGGFKLVRAGSKFQVERVNMPRLVVPGPGDKEKRSQVHDDPPQPTFEFKPSKPGDSVAVRTEGKRTVLVISSKTGIGGLTIRLKGGEWPREVSLRFQYDQGKGFHNLESFTLTTDRLWVGGKLSGEAEQLPFSFRNAAGEIEKDATGSQVISGSLRLRVQKGKEGIEATLPANLFVGSKEVTLGWIDAFRR